MDAQQPKFHEWFHKFLIYFALWMFAAFAVLNSIKYIMDCREDGYDGSDFVLILIVNVLIIAVGFFIIKARFDLAAFREKAPKELLIAFVTWAVLCLLNHLARDYIGNDDVDSSFIITAVILAGWGIALYRYYHARGYLFKKPAE